MKRQKRTRKLSLPSVMDGIKKTVLKKIAGLIIIFAICLAAFVSAKAYLYRSEYFKLKVAETKGVFLDQNAIYSINSQLLNMYKGINVFRMNLKGIAESVQRSYPDAKEVTVKVVLPDKLSVIIKFRRPIAVVKDGRVYPIDEDGFVLPSVNIESLNDLPLIEGVSIRYNERKGAQSSSRNLQCALDLLKEIKRFKGIDAYGVRLINATDINELAFFLKNDIEVKIGYENLGERLELLESTLKDPRLALDRIRYIDVRFKDVIIGPK